MTSAQRARILFGARHRRQVALGIAAVVAGAIASGCSKGASADTSSAASNAPDSAASTPVHMATVQLGNIAIAVGGPGKTDALDLQKVRAPFTGTVTSLHVNIGDHVGAGQVIGAMVSQPSEAALTGAESMLRGAQTASERSDAERALALARQNLVAAPLRAPRGGVVISRGASQGDLLTQGDSVASIAAAGSVAFVARIAQGDLTRVRPGQHATVTLPGQTAPVPGVVHGLLPIDTAGTMTVPVRVDLKSAPQTAGAPIQMGLFGTAQIVVGEKVNVPIVPAAAVLRDDISGISRVAVVAPNGIAHWVTVTTGASQAGNVEIVTPVLSPGQRVIVTGQVGLPDSTRVREAGNLITP